MANSIELLAPAGGIKELKAAVASGADAVYLGAAAFSARAGAENFDAELMREAVSFAHTFGVKVHCAINTLIKENELDTAIETAISANNCGVDAIIIQDIGLAAHIRKVLPDMEFHASTQMTVTSLDGVRYLEQKGFSRVVLARELSEKEIEYITRNANAQIEVFVHGAICMSYSGQCLMSSILGGRSGNRGRCAQPCRLHYSLCKNGKPCDDAYILSPKDMALIKHLDKLKRMGVASLKIEGRLKSPEYVSEVVGIYRKYLDNPAPVTDSDMTELKNAFSRSGFTDGYFTAKLGKGMMAHENPANNSGSIYTREAKDRALGKGVCKIPVNIYATLLKDDVLRLTIYDDDGNCVVCEGAVKSEPALTRPIDTDRLKDQLRRLGDTPFEAGNIETELDEGITIPVKEINDVRRRACDMLQSERIKMPEKRVVNVPLEFKQKSAPDSIYLTAEVRTEEQGVAVLKAGGIKRLYAPVSVAEKLRNISHDTEIVIKTPDILKDVDIPTGFVSVSSTAALQKYKSAAKYGDFRLNVFNSLTANELGALKSITLSPELNLSEIREIAEHTPDIETEIIAYGHIPLMIMRNCPIKARGYCQNGKDIYTLKDRKGIEFPVICSEDCHAVILNSKPVFTADIIHSIRASKINSLRLNFSVENYDQCGKIVGVYRAALEGKKIESMAENTFTRGHLRRGIL